MIILLTAMLVSVLASVGFCGTRFEGAPGIDVSVSPPNLAGGVGSGYFRVDVTVMNTGTKAAKVGLHFIGNNYYTSLNDLSNSAVVQPNSSVILPIYVPPCNFDGNSIEVEYNGRRVGEVQCSVDLTNYSEMSQTLLVSRKMQQIEMSWRDNFPDFSSSGSVHMAVSGRTVARFAPAVATMAVQSWNADWLAYTGYSAVIVTSEEMDQMPSDVKTALIRYVETGGVLVVNGKYTPEPDFSHKSSGFNYGKAYEHGFGNLVVLDTGLSDTWTLSLWTKLSEFWDKGSAAFNYYRYPSNYNPYNNMMPVVAKDRVPVGLLFLVLLVFVVVAGPMTTFVFARKEKRMRIYWIVPGCSLLASFIIISVAIASEGISSLVRTASVIYLDENTHRMAMVSNLGYFCPVPPRELKFDNNIQLMLEENSDRYYNNDSSQRSIDFSSGQSYRGWINARVPTYFKARSSMTCRDHIAVRTEPDGGMSVVNNLKGQIEKLYIADSSGTIYVGSELPVGQSVVLAPGQAPAGTSDDNGASSSVLNAGYSGQWHIVASGNLAGDVSDWLKPGRYIAVMEKDDYVQVGTEKYKSNGSDAVIFGISEVKN